MLLWLKKTEEKTIRLPKEKSEDKVTGIALNTVAMTQCLTHRSNLKKAHLLSKRKAS